MEKKFEVQAIENGTVIDHLPTDKLFKIINILELEQDTHRMTIGNNLESKLMGIKAIIKVNDRYLSQEEINRIAIVAPMAVVNHIHDYKVTEKHRVAVPERVEGFVRCANPKCITNNEPVKTSFTVLEGATELALLCKYCEKKTAQHAIQIIK